MQHMILEYCGSNYNTVNAARYLYGILQNIHIPVCMVLAVQ